MSKYGRSKKNNRLNSWDHLLSVFFWDSHDLHLESRLYSTRFLANCLEKLTYCLIRNLKSHLILPQCFNCKYRIKFCTRKTMQNCRIEALKFVDFYLPQRLYSSQRNLWLHITKLFSFYVGNWIWCWTDLNSVLQQNCLSSNLVDSSFKNR